MTVEVMNNWPLMVITPPSERPLQKEPAPHLPKKNRQRLDMSDKRRMPQADIYLEKGIFVDIYV